MRRDNVEALMMSKRFLLVIVFLGSAFTAVDSDTTAAVADSVTVGSATDRDSSSDSTPGSDAPAAEAISSAGQLLETTANSEAATTINAESSSDSAETTEPLQEAATTTRLFDPEDRADGGRLDEKVTTRASDAGTTAAEALSTTATREAAADGQSTEIGIEPSTAAENEVTTDSGIASSKISSQGDSAGQTGTEKVSDSDVQAATSGAEVSEKTTMTTPPNVDENKSTAGSENEGAPKDDQSKGDGPDGTTPRQNIWQAHRGLFITIGIMIAVCIVIGTLCLICLKCRGKSSSDKQRIKVEEGVPGPLDASSPIPDEEMVKDEAPMQEVENPAVTPNGGGQHISKDEEDNGWVVPLDELTKPEKDKPETENTKL